MYTCAYMLLMTMVACTNAAVDTEVLPVSTLFRLHLSTVTLLPPHSTSAVLTQEGQ